MVVLCEGDPGCTAPTSTCTPGWGGASLRDRARRVVGGAAAAAVGRPLVQHDESLTILVGTLPPEELRARLAGADAAAILKLGRSFPEVRAALADTGLLERAHYVERAGSDAQRVAPWPRSTPPACPTCRWRSCQGGANGPRPSRASPWSASAPATRHG